MSELWEYDLKFTSALHACWVVSDRAAAKSISELTAIQSDCLTAPWAVDIVRSSPYWFWQRRGGLVCGHSLQIFLFSWRTISRTMFALLYCLLSVKFFLFPILKISSGWQGLLISSRIDVANANRRTSCECNSTLMITCWPAAVYLLSSSLALCCVIESGWPEGWKTWGGEERRGEGRRRRGLQDKNWMKDSKRSTGGSSVCVPCYMLTRMRVRRAVDATLILFAYIIFHFRWCKHLHRLDLNQTRRRACVFFIWDTF